MKRRQGYIRAKLLKKRGWKIGKNVYIGKGVVIKCKNLVIEDDCFILDNVFIDCPEIILKRNTIIFSNCYFKVKKNLVLGERSKISRNCIFKGQSIVGERDLWCNENVEVGGGGWNSPKANLYIGPFQHIGKNVHINVCEEVRLKGFSGIGMDCMIFTHGAGQGQSVFKGYSLTEGPVYIGQHVSINSRVIVAPDSIINDGCCVGASAYVSGELSSNGLYVGIPARYKKDIIELTDEMKKTIIVKHFGLKEDQKNAYSGIYYNSRITFYNLNEIILEKNGCHQVVIDINASTIKGIAYEDSEKIRDEFRRMGEILIPSDGYIFAKLDPFVFLERGIEVE